MPHRTPTLHRCASLLFTLIVGTAAAAGQSGEEAPTRIGDAYPLDVCAVTGNPLGSSPVVVVLSDMPRTEWNGREVRFCCSGCKGTFDSDPAAGNRKLDEMIITDQLRVYPAGTCIVMEDEVMTDPTGPDAAKDKNVVVGNRLYRLCCKSCVRRIKKNPDEYRKVLDDRIKKAQSATYPLKVCVITGRPYGDKPFELVVANRLVRTCCGGCGERVRNNPALAIKKLEAGSNPNGTPLDSKKTGLNRPNDS